MAPPPSSNGQLPLAERLKSLATTLQFAWFIGHFTLLLAVIRYILSYVTFNASSKWASFSYRTAFVSAVATYGIVVYKAYRSRVRPGQNKQQNPQQLALMLLGDENVQYLLISLVWLFSRQVSLAVLPFAVYSVFHVATYTRTWILPAFQAPKQSTTQSSPGTPPKAQGGIAATIGKFVKEYYDASMMLVAGLEILLVLRLFISALSFSKGSWILLGLYSVFLRARYQQSPFVQSAFSQGAARIDQQVQQPNIPPAVKQGWEAIKQGSAAAINATDVKKYFGGAQNAQKKPQ